MQYKCTVHESTSNVVALATGVHATPLTTLGVDADGVDDARRKVREALRAQGYTIRAVSFTTPQSNRGMVAYVEPKKKG